MTTSLPQYQLLWSHQSPRSLLPSLQAADVCGSLEIDSAIDTVKCLSMELAEAKREAQQGKLVPLPGESVESCALELGATSKTVGSSMAQLLTAANQGGWGNHGVRI